MSRLIDADKLEPDAEWSNYYDEFMPYSQHQIRDAEEVKAIPLGKVYRMSISNGSEFARYAKEQFGYETSLKPSSDPDTFEKLFGPEDEVEE